MSEILQISIAVVLSSNRNMSTARSVGEICTHLESSDVKVELYIPDISYFHSYLFNFIRLLKLDPSKFYTNPLINRVAYFLIKIFFLIARKQYSNFPFQKQINYFKANKILDLSAFDYVITHNPYLLPFLKSKYTPLVTINADYFHQEKVSKNPSWWSFTTNIIRCYPANLFTVSTFLYEKYTSLGFQITGVIPDGPDYSAIHFLPAKSRDNLLIYAHDSRDKGINCLDTETILLLNELIENKISLIGSNLDLNLPDKFQNLGMLPYKLYLSSLNNYKIFLYLSNSDGFESPPMDALLSGCIVVSSKTPGALYCSLFTNRILLLDSMSKIDIQNTLAMASVNYSDLSRFEYDYLFQCARQHSSFEGAKRYLEFIKNKKDFTGNPPINHRPQK